MYNDGVNNSHLSLEDRFPAREKLATDLDAQIAWLVREMGYSRDKTKGYEEKLVRLGRLPEDSQSVFGFMGGYWHRFRIADEGFAELASQEMADKSLQALAKVVAGLGDKVALATWFRTRGTTESDFDIESLISDTLLSVHDEVIRNPDKHSEDELERFVNAPTFDGNPMGRAILELHRTLASQPEDCRQLHDSALAGTVSGLLMWRHYANGLEATGLSVIMPKPGLSSGNMEPWS